MTRILHISKYYYPYIGGTEQVARDVVNALNGENIEMQLMKHTFQRKMYRIRFLNVKVQEPVPSNCAASQRMPDLREQDLDLPLFQKI